MATMTIRTTVAFDPATAARLERLAKRWGVSKSEALRRALEAAEKQTIEAPDSSDLSDEELARMTPLEIMEWLHAHPQVPPGWGEEFRRELSAQRELDAEIEEERQQRRREAMVASPATDYQA